MTMILKVIVGQRQRAHPCFQRIEPPEESREPNGEYQRTGDYTAGGKQRERERHIFHLDLVQRKAFVTIMKILLCIELPLVPVP